MRNFNDLLRKSSSFFIIAIIEWIYFPFGLIKAILKCLRSNYDLNRFGVQELFKKNEYEETYNYSLYRCNINSYFTYNIQLY
ncbi:hypothetical protein EPL64_04620 [Clostridioides difficile]|nr:hypothetical protein [Clostridioides difficile]